MFYKTKHLYQKTKQLLPSYSRDALLHSVVLPTPTETLNRIIRNWSCRVHFLWIIGDGGRHSGSVICGVSPQSWAQARLGWPGRATWSLDAVRVVLFHLAVQRHADPESLMCLRGETLVFYLWCSFCFGCSTKIIQLEIHKSKGPLFVLEACGWAVMAHPGVLVAWAQFTTTLIVSYQLGSMHGCQPASTPTHALLAYFQFGHSKHSLSCASVHHPSDQTWCWLAFWKAARR